jgi:hypothetical protein
MLEAKHQPEINVTIISISINIHGLLPSPVSIWWRVKLRAGAALQALPEHHP